MKITFVRHCEVEEVYKDRYNGHNDVGLSKNGEMQAKELAKRLDMSDFDAVFCSDLKRAKETLKHSLHVKKAIFTNRLREKSWGKHEGLSFDEIIAQGEIEYVDFLQWIEALDGEPYKDFVKRVEKFFLEFLPSLKKESILAITHGGVIRTLISMFKNISLESAFSINITHGSIIRFDTIEKSFIKEDNEHI